MSCALAQLTDAPNERRSVCPGLCHPVPRRGATPELQLRAHQTESQYQSRVPGIRAAPCLYNTGRQVDRKSKRRRASQPPPPTHMNGV